MVCGVSEYPSVCTFLHKQTSRLVPHRGPISATALWINVPVDETVEGSEGELGGNAVEGV